MRIAYSIAVLLIMAVRPCSADEPRDSAAEIAALRERVRQLEAEVDKLSAVIEGTAQPINLARTDFAAVTAANANGGRSLANDFYGIRNAFDDGQNWHNGLNYSYWLSSGGQGMFVEVRFDHPVTVTSLFVEGGPSCTPTFGFEKGGERSFPAFTETFDPGRSLHGVNSLRLTFPDSNGNVKVNELRVMGHPPHDLKFEVTRPRLLLDARLAEEMAVDAFMEIGLPPHVASRSVVEKPDRWIITFRHLQDDVDLFRVVVHRHTSKVETQQLAKWTPREPE